jgi:hypothetical protein
MTCLKENQVHYRIYKTHQMGPVLTQINPHNTLKTHAFQLNILLSCHLCLVLPHIYDGTIQSEPFIPRALLLQRRPNEPQKDETKDPQKIQVLWHSYLLEHRNRLFEEL